VIPEVVEGLEDVRSGVVPADEEEMLVRFHREVRAGQTFERTVDDLGGERDEYADQDDQPGGHEGESRDALGPPLILAERAGIEQVVHRPPERIAVGGKGVQAEVEQRAARERDQDDPSQQQGHPAS